MVLDIRESEMKIKCVDNSGVEKFLSVGAEYEVWYVDEAKDMFQVEYQKDKGRYFSAERFIHCEEHNLIPESEKTHYISDKVKAHWEKEEQAQKERQGSMEAMEVAEKDFPSQAFFVQDIPSR